MDKQSDRERDGKIERLREIEIDRARKREEKEEENMNKHSPQKWTNKKTDTLKKTENGDKTEHNGHVPPIMAKSDSFHACLTLWLIKFDGWVKFGISIYQALHKMIV